MIYLLQGSAWVANRCVLGRTTEVDESQSEGQSTRVLKVLGGSKDAMYDASSWAHLHRKNMTQLAASRRLNGLNGFIVHNTGELEMTQADKERI